MAVFTGIVNHLSPIHGHWAQAKSRIDSLDLVVGKCAPMTLSKWLVLIGGVLLLVGLATAFISSRYSSRVMGEARKGVAVLAPEKDSLKWKQKERLLSWADFWFWVGLWVTAIGVVLQTLGSILPMKP